MEWARAPRHGAVASRGSTPSREALSCPRLRCSERSWTCQSGVVESLPRAPGGSDCGSESTRVSGPGRVRACCISSTTSRHRSAQPRSTSARGTGTSCHGTLPVSARGCTHSTGRAVHQVFRSDSTCCTFTSRSPLSPTGFRWRRPWYAEEARPSPHWRLSESPTETHRLLSSLHLLELFVRHEEARSSAGGLDDRFYPEVEALLGQARGSGAVPCGRESA